MNSGMAQVVIDRLNKDLNGAFIAVDNQNRLLLNWGCRVSVLGVYPIRYSWQGA